jgi:hypothetical protein
MFRASLTYSARFFINISCLALIITTVACTAPADTGTEGARVAPTTFTSPIITRDDPRAPGFPGIVGSEAPSLTDLTNHITVLQQALLRQRQGDAVTTDDTDEVARLTQALADAQRAHAGGAVTDDDDRTETSELETAITWLQQELARVEGKNGDLSDENGGLTERVKQLEEDSHAAQQAAADASAAANGAGPLAYTGSPDAATGAVPQLVQGDCNKEDAIPVGFYMRTDSAKRKLHAIINLWCATSTNGHETGSETQHFESNVSDDKYVGGRGGSRSIPVRCPSSHALTGWQIDGTSSATFQASPQFPFERMASVTLACRSLANLTTSRSTTVSLSLDISLESVVQGPQRDCPSGQVVRRIAVAARDQGGHAGFVAGIAGECGPLSATQQAGLRQTPVGPVRYGTGVQYSVIKAKDYYDDSIDQRFGPPTPFTPPSTAAVTPGLNGGVAITDALLSDRHSCFLLCPDGMVPTQRHEKTFLAAIRTSYAWRDDRYQYLDQWTCAPLMANGVDHYGATADASIFCGGRVVKPPLTNVGIIPPVTMADVDAYEFLRLSADRVADPEDDNCPVDMRILALELGIIPASSSPLGGRPTISRLYCALQSNATIEDATQVPADTADTNGFLPRGKIVANEPYLPARSLEGRTIIQCPFRMYLVGWAWRKFGHSTVPQHSNPGLEVEWKSEVLPLCRDYEIDYPSAQ